MTVSARRVLGVPARIALVVAAAMVPAMVLAFALIGYDTYERERARLTRDLLGTARALVAVVDTDFVAVESAVFALASSPHLSAGDFAAFHAQASAALRKQPFDNVVVTEADGRQLLNTLRPFGAPLPGQGGRRLQKVHSAGTPVVSDVFVGQVSNKPMVVIGVPAGEGPPVRHAVSAGVSSERLSALLSRQRLPAGWIAGIFDSTGTLAARTHEAGRFVGQKGSPELVRRMQEVLEDTIESTTLEGIDVVTVFSRSAQSGWTVAIGIPKRELATQLWIAMGRLFVTIFIMLLVALVLGVAVSRWLVR
jgi:hypothetical protein